MAAEQKYGKITQSDIESLFMLLPLLEEERRAFQAKIEQKPEKFAEKFLSFGFTWAKLYEVPFLKLLHGFVAVAGIEKVIGDAFKQENPIKAVLEIPDDILESEWASRSGGQYTHGDLLGYLHAVVGNMDCLLIYGSYLSDFVAGAREGDLKALMKAIRIDPTVATGPTAQYYLSIAVVAGDRDFVDEIRKAMAGKTGKEDAYLKKFRLLMQLLHEADALGLPTKEIKELVSNVGAYDRSGDREFTADKNISELILKAKALKKKTIPK